MKTNRKKTDLSGMGMVSGAAAGAAAGSFIGPLGAAVGAVVGGAVGAKTTKKGVQAVVKNVKSVATSKSAKATVKNVADGIAAIPSSAKSLFAKGKPAKKDTTKPVKTARGRGTRATAGRRK